MVHPQVHSLYDDPLRDNNGRAEESPAADSQATRRPRSGGWAEGVTSVPPPDVCGFRPAARGIHIYPMSYWTHTDSVLKLKVPPWRLQGSGARRPTDFWCAPKEMGLCRDDSMLSLLSL